LLSARHWLVAQDSFGVDMTSPHPDVRSGHAVEAFSAATSPVAEEWKRPIPFNEFDLPEFPTSALPEWLRKFVDAESTATQTPPDLAAMLALAAVATAVSKKAVVQVKAGYSEPLNIYTAVAMNPGERKSAVFSEVVHPIEEFERAEAKRSAQQIAGAKARKLVLEKELKAALRGTDGDE
jgi:replicative DNA helicase